MQSRSKRTKAALERRCEHGIVINPIAQRGAATFGRTLKKHSAARALQFDYFNLAACDRMLTRCAKSPVVERMPEMEFIESPQDIKFVLRRQSHRTVGAHARQWQSSRSATIGRRAIRRIGGIPIFSAEKNKSVCGWARRRLLFRGLTGKLRGRPRWMIPMNVPNESPAQRFSAGRETFRNGKGGP